MLQTALRSQDLRHNSCCTANAGFVRLIRGLIRLHLQGRRARNHPLLVVREQGHQTFRAQDSVRYNKRLLSQGIMIRGRVALNDRRTLRAPTRGHRALIVHLGAEKAGRCNFEIRRQFDRGTRSHVARDNPYKGRVNSRVNSTGLSKQFSNTIGIRNFHISTVLSRVIICRLIRYNNSSLTFGVLGLNGQQVIQNYRARHKNSRTGLRVLLHVNTKIRRRVVPNSSGISNTTASVSHGIRKARMRRLGVVIKVLRSRLTEITPRAMTNFHRRIPNKFKRRTLVERDSS